jgi:hypothetical protein
LDKGVGDTSKDPSDIVEYQGVIKFDFTGWRSKRINLRRWSVKRKRIEMLKIIVKEFARSW